MSYNLELQIAKDIIQSVDISHNLHMPDMLGQSHGHRLWPEVSLNSTQQQNMIIKY